MLSLAKIYILQILICGILCSKLREILDPNSSLHSRQTKIQIPDNMPPLHGNSGDKNQYSAHPREKSNGMSYSMMDKIARILGSNGVRLTSNSHSTRMPTRAQSVETYIIRDQDPQVVLKNIEDIIDALKQLSKETRKQINLQKERGNSYNNGKLPSEISRLQDNNIDREYADVKEYQKELFEQPFVKATTDEPAPRSGLFSSKTLKGANNNKKYHSCLKNTNRNNNKNNDDMDERPEKIEKGENPAEVPNFVRMLQFGKNLIPDEKSLLQAVAPLFELQKAQTRKFPKDEECRTEPINILEISPKKNDDNIKKALFEKIFSGTSRNRKGLAAQVKSFTNAQIDDLITYLESLRDLNEGSTTEAETAVTIMTETETETSTKCTTVPTKCAVKSCDTPIVFTNDTAEDSLLGLTEKSTVLVDYNTEIDDEEGDGSLLINRNLDNASSLYAIVEKEPSIKDMSKPLFVKRSNSERTNERLGALMEEVNKKLAKEYNKNALAQWAYETNINKATQQAAMSTSLMVSRVERRLVNEINDTLCEMNLKDACPSLQRQVALVMKLGTSALTDDKYKRLSNVLKDMSTIYSTATICNYHQRCNCDMRLDPEITQRMAKSRDPDELLYIWTAWRNATGRNMKKLYPQYVELMNEAAYLNNYCDAAYEWLTEFDPLQPVEMKDIAQALWRQVEPLYKQLHAYVRFKLRRIYGESLIPYGGCIPAHLLGNMWAQTWSNLFNITMPFPSKRTPDITEAMNKKGYTPEKMFRIAEKFFVSLNMSAMPTSFWNNSIISRPSEDCKMVCHASAWDMFDGKDFRIKMCAEVTYENFITIHHEMGHVQYYLQYKNQPLPFRDGANPGFHEAIGDTIALSVMNTCHLKKIGLLEHVKCGSNKNRDKDDDKDDNKESCSEKDESQEEEDEITDKEEDCGIKGLRPQDKRDLNFLLMMALEKVAFLPFGYLVDLWRWDVFEGKVHEDDYNKHWWKLRDKYQGVCPPTERSEDDFDPGAKYHIASGVPYLRYFVSFILQFQFHSALCQRAGEYTEACEEEEDPNINTFLYRCDIYGSPAAGQQLKEALSLGCSRPWPDIMSLLANDDRMDATALLKYFEPLYRFLKQQNKINKEEVGWGETVPC